MAKQEGDKNYPEKTKYKAMQLWATGVFGNDEHIAAKLGVKRVDTIGNWRQTGVPEDWHAFRARIEERTREKTEAKVSDKLSDVVARQLVEVRELQEQLLAEMLISEPGKTDAMARALIALKDKEIELMGGARETTAVRISDMTDEQLRDVVRGGTEGPDEGATGSGSGTEAEGEGEGAAPGPDAAAVPD